MIPRCPISLTSSAGEAIRFSRRNNQNLLQLWIGRDALDDFDIDPLRDELDRRGLSKEVEEISEQVSSRDIYRELPEGPQTHLNLLVLTGGYGNSAYVIKRETAFLSTPQLRRRSEQAPARDQLPAQNCSIPTNSRAINTQVASSAISYSILLPAIHVPTTTTRAKNCPSSSIRKVRRFPTILPGVVPLTLSWRDSKPCLCGQSSLGSSGYFCFAWFAKINRIWRDPTQDQD